MIIAIDGYSSCGKSTVAKALAKRLKLAYIDSGAMYRAVTYYFLKNNIPFPQAGNANEFIFDFSPVLNKIHIAFKLNESTGVADIYLNDVNIEKEIREMEVSENVSHVSAIKEVRKRLVQMQQHMTNYGNLVMDGRDIGTTVFPNADLKIFMTASADVRTYRRYHELIGKGIKVTPEEIRKNLENRDYEDSHRSESPLRKAEDAVLLDNTFMTQDEQIAFVLHEVEKIKTVVKAN
jgi:cytidylate kinase